MSVTPSRNRQVGTVCLLTAVLLLGACRSNFMATNSPNKCSTNDSLVGSIANFDSGKTNLIGSLTFTKNLVTWFGQDESRVFIRTEGLDPITEEFVDRKEFWDGTYLFSPFPDSSVDLTLVDDGPILPIWRYILTTQDKCEVVRNGPSWEFVIEQKDQEGKVVLYNAKIEELPPHSKDPWIPQSSFPECQIAGVRLPGPKSNIPACPSGLVFR